MSFLFARLTAPQVSNSRAKVSIERFISRLKELFRRESGRNLTVFTQKTPIRSFVDGFTTSGRTYFHASNAAQVSTGINVRNRRGT